MRFEETFFRDATVYTYLYSFLQYCSTFIYYYLFAHSIFWQIILSYFHTTLSYNKNLVNVNCSEFVCA